MGGQVSRWSAAAPHLQTHLPTPVPDTPAATLTPDPSAPGMGEGRSREQAVEGPWNPGVKSRLPARLLPLSTIFRPENVFAGVERVKELHDLTGLDFSEMVCFRPERLALHELLIRVTADLWVSDGSRYEDLGINFRSMIATILARYVDPDMGRIANAYNESREALRAIISQALASATETTSAAASRQRGLRSLFASRAGRRSAVEREDDGMSLLHFADECEKTAAEADAANHASAVVGDAGDPRAAAFRALARICRALYGKVGGWRTASELAASVATDLACNEYCARQIGRLIEQHVLEAVRREGYRLLPHRDPDGDDADNAADESPEGGLNRSRERR